MVPQYSMIKKLSIMTQNDKELLLKDLCARLPYVVKVKVLNEDILHYDYTSAEGGFIKGVENVNDGLFAIKCKEEGYVLSYDEFKPYLFPLSSMSEKQERELVNLTGYKSECEAYCGFDSMGYYIKNVGEFEYEEGQHSFKFYPDYIGLDWFNAHHIDYRGLIEMELAIDATGKNIY